MWRLYTLHNVRRTLSYITLSKYAHYLICTLLMYKKNYRRRSFFNFKLSLLNINYLPPIKVILSFHHYICLCVFVCSCFFVFHPLDDFCLLPRPAGASLLFFVPTHLGRIYLLIYTPHLSSPGSRYI
jgi:hypothetical protein